MTEKTFYRYVRPLQLDENRLELVPLSTGGVLLRFEEHQDGTLSFTHARCHPADHFSQQVARKVADQRAQTWIPQLYPILGGLQNRDLIETVMQRCFSPSLSDKYGYLGMELTQLGSALNELLQRNAYLTLLLEERKQQIGIVDVYRNLGHADTNG